MKLSSPSPFSLAALVVSIFGWVFFKVFHLEHFVMFLATVLQTSVLRMQAECT